jgi:hypothetical protein
LVTDEGAFKKGLGVLNMLPGMLGKTGAAVLGVGSAFVAMGASSAAALTKLADNAKILGLSARQLDNWRNTARIAGGDADAFQESLNTLNKTFFNLKIGEVDKGVIQALGMSGNDFGAMQKMPMQERIQYVLTRLESIKDPEQQKALTAQLLGQNGLTMLANNQLNRTNFAADYQNAASRNLYSEEDYATALKGNKALDEVRVSLEESFNKIGIEIEASLLPQLELFSKWLKDNKTSLDELAKAIGGVSSALFGFIGGLVSNGSFEETLTKAGLNDLDRTALDFALTFGDKKALELKSLVTSGKISASEAVRLNKLDTGVGRESLIEAGAKGLAFSANSQQVTAIFSAAMAYIERTQGTQAALNASPGQIGSVIQSAVKELNININTSGPISDAQAKMIASAVSSRVNSMGIRQ